MLEIIEIANGEIFEHVDMNGVHRFFNITELYPYAVEHGEPIISAVAPAVRYAEKCGVEEWKIERLCEPYLSRPVLGVLFPDGTTHLVDGSHRIMRLWRDGVRDFKMYRVKSLAECDPFMIKNIDAWAVIGNGHLET